MDSCRWNSLMSMSWLRKQSAENALALLLETCLAQIERGEATVESCLADHPEQAVRLEPLLRTALATRHVLVPGPSSAAHARMRARVLAATAPRPMPIR